jgi:RNA polymerase sigma factor (sigma-70 family)
MANFPDTPVSLLVRIASEKTGVCDEAAWTRLFELYAPVIRAFAEERGVGDEGDDVVQEIFMKLVAVLGDGKVKVGGDAGKFRRYLATLIRNELVSRWRRRQARGEGAVVSLDDPKAGVEPVVDSETAARIDAKWQFARHRAAVEWTLAKTALSAQSKAVYRAYVVEERPIGEVAAAFGISRNAVSQIKTRVERMVAAVEAEF